jgi:hypothetical protein
MNLILIHFSKFIFSLFEFLKMITAFICLRDRLIPKRLIHTILLAANPGMILWCGKYPKCISIFVAAALRYPKILNIYAYNTLVKYCIIYRREDYLPDLHKIRSLHIKHISFLKIAISASNTEALQYIYDICVKKEIPAKTAYNLMHVAFIRGDLGVIIYLHNHFKIPISIRDLVYDNSYKYDKFYVYLVKNVVHDLDQINQVIHMRTLINANALESFEFAWSLNRKAIMSVTSIHYISDEIAMHILHMAETCSEPAYITFCNTCILRLAIRDNNPKIIGHILKFLIRHGMQDIAWENKVFRCLDNSCTLPTIKIMVGFYIRQNYAEKLFGKIRFFKLLKLREPEIMSFIMYAYKNYSPYTYSKKDLCEAAGNAVLNYL